jgi:hypothetical protein
MDGFGSAAGGERVGRVVVGPAGAVVGGAVSDVEEAPGADPDGDGGIAGEGLDVGSGELGATEGPQLARSVPNARAPTSAARASPANPATLRREIEFCLMGRGV